MTEQTLMLSAGRLKLPVRVVPHGKKLGLIFRKYDPLITEVKCMRGADYVPPAEGGPMWTVTDCRRNWIQLEILAGETPPEFKRYLSPLTETRPRRSALLPHQVQMFKFVMNRRRCILAAEMGTGKTLAAIEAMEKVQGEWWWVGMKKPLRAAELEFEKWNCRAKPELINYEMLRKRLVKHRGSTPNGVVFDESSRLKNGDAAWTRAAQHLANAVREEHDGYLILMTGTPAPHDPGDWHSQMEIVCPGWLRESTAARLRQRLIEVTEWGGTPTGQRYPVNWNWKPDEVELLGRRLEGPVLVIRSADCQELPEIRRDVVELSVSKAAQRAAKLIANTSPTAAQALNRLRQLSDGFQYREDAPADRCETPKDEALRQFLGEFEESGRVMVFATYNESVDRCAEICIEEGWHVLKCDGRGWASLSPGEKPHSSAADGWLREFDRKTMTGRPEKLAFVAHPKSGGFGLNLAACPAALSFSSDFDWESATQAEKRGHREGMDVGRGFMIRYLCHLPTDKYVLENHSRKKRLQDYILDEIRRLLK